MLKPIAWTGNALRLLDQTKLPVETCYIDIADERQMHDAIRRLVVRGAPAIGIAGAFGAYVGVRKFSENHPDQFLARLKEICDYLATSRPTAVNLCWALDRVQRVARDICGAATGASPPCHVVRDALDAVLDECLAMLDEDERVCRAIGEHGLTLLSARRGTTNILTHCNAGGLATAGYGTALAPIYLGAERGMSFHVFADETRPLLQGSRLTAFELKQNGIPVTVICDSAAATVMSAGKVDAVLVGADRIAANGDTANKIGTLAVAIAAKHFGVPFYVAAPTSTIDLNSPDGKSIPIEQRDAGEITTFTTAFNPAFDVTPAALIGAIITERGIIRPPYLENLKKVVA